MTLRGWSWEAALGPAGVGDRPLLEALEAALPDAAVEATIEATGTRERRRRRLPTHPVVALVVAMGLRASESMRHVLAEVVAGWREGAARDEADWLLDQLRRRLLSAQAARLQFDTLRLRLIKIGGRVRERTDSIIPDVCIHLSSHHPGLALWLLLARARRIHSWRW